ncbi:MAG: ABC transporter ATP-binding protein [Chloroflexi bacterium]|nr:ABC transporter ATP-binding protein [Chloroflexota bacterium]
MAGLVELSDLVVRFHARTGLFRTVAIHAVDGVSLTIEAGETVALVGESGSGKTTLGRASLRLVRPASGSVRFDGRDITDAPERELKEFRRQAQAIFQDPYSSLNPYHTVREAVEEPLAVHGIGTAAERTDRARKALEDVQLRPADVFLPMYPHLLSGGQRQRVGIARALVLEPRYVVADEPVSMIDASSRAELLYLLRDLQATYGIAFLYVTHDIASARHFAGRIAVMYLGSIVEIGTPEAVVERPLHPYTKALIDAVPEPDPANRLRERAVVPGEVPSAADPPAGCPFHPRCPRFMAGRCELQRPTLREVEPGHYAACYLYEDET